MKDYKSISTLFLILSILFLVISILALCWIIYEFGQYRPDFLEPLLLLAFSAPLSISSYIIYIFIEIADNAQRILFYINPENEKFKSRAITVSDKQYREAYQGRNIYFGNGKFSVSGTDKLFDTLDEARNWIRSRTT